MLHLLKMNCLSKDVLTQLLSIEIHRGIQLEVDHRLLYIAQSSPQSFF